MLKKKTQDFIKVKEHWAEFSALMAGGRSKQGAKKKFTFEESEEGESEMVVCVRVRPRLVGVSLFSRDLSICTN